ncbi:MAG TPA: hypothetical protein VFN26_21885 [Candidatus Acidoferrum sp.]|nr:hypothetical protein [Candidatus Acidoferrum sp.]
MTYGKPNCSRLGSVFCPHCKVEYRPGFTHCTDCDVDLVDALPAAEEGVSKALSTGSLEILWEGDDLALFEDLLHGLEGAAIRYFDQPLSIYPGVRRWDHFPLQPMSRYGYQVAVLSSDLELGRRILAKLLEDKPQDMELPALDEKKGETPQRITPTGETTTCEVWSGKDENLREFLTSALRENGVSMRFERQGEGSTIYVPREAERRAREIVREIVQGAPPE